MKGRVGLVVWLTVDGLPTQVVTCQLQVERRTECVTVMITTIALRTMTWI